MIATIASVILIIVVLLQSSKGGGLAGTFGGAGNVGAMFGTRRTADFLSKATWWLGGIVAVLALVINLFFLPGQTTQEQRSVIQDAGKTVIPQTPTVPPTQLPPTGDQNQGGQQQQQQQ